MNYKAEVLANKKLTENILELDLKLLEPTALDFKAGQFVQLLVGKDIKDKREYSIITPPADSGTIGFCVNISPMGIGSKYILSLKAGDTVEFEGPHGMFFVK